MPGQQNNLVSTNKFAEQDYVHVFDNEKVSVYNANDVKITTTCVAVLRDWRVPQEGLWRFPLTKDA